jgi:hypothetical protein
MVNKSSRKLRDAATQLDYWYADDRGAGLQRVPVLSNTTGLLQSEEMIGLGGALSLTYDPTTRRISGKNSLDFPIRDLGVVGVSAKGELLSGWIGTPDAGDSVDCELEVRGVDDRWRSEWDRLPVIAKPTVMRAEDGVLWSSEVTDDIYLGSLLNEFSERYPLRAGEMIALGWTDSELTRLQITPTTTQKKHKTLVLLHIRAADLGEVRPDTRIFARNTEQTVP